MRNVLLCSALAVLAAGCGDSSVVAQTAQAAPHEVAAFFAVDFDDPTAFNCTTQDTCMSCKNVTNKASAVIVTHTPDASQETHMIVPGAQLRTCGNVAFLPHEG